MVFLVHILKRCWRFLTNLLNQMWSDMPNGYLCNMMALTRSFLPCSSLNFQFLSSAIVSPSLFLFSVEFPCNNCCFISAWYFKWLVPWLPPAVSIFLQYLHCVSYNLFPRSTLLRTSHTIELSFLVFTLDWVDSPDRGSSFEEPTFFKSSRKKTLFC